jgi:guanyl-specific ribonuclease Sa
MLKNYSQFITGIIVGVVLGFFIARQVTTTNPGQGNPATPRPVTQDNRQLENTATQNQGGETSNSEIPQKVYDVLKYIRANHHALDGYVGGRVFTNREKIVPQADDQRNLIDYQEWDVNPKVEGQNRGTERILTGSDGRAWYTNDHYQSFKEIK